MWLFLHLAQASYSIISVFVSKKLNFVPHVLTILNQLGNSKAGHPRLMQVFVHAGPHSMQLGRRYSVQLQMGSVGSQLMLPQGNV